MQLFPALPEVVQGTFRPASFGRLERRGGGPCERGIFIVDHTTNYQLSQWETTDRILMSDFNTDNSKIDAALKAQSDAIAGKAAQSTVNNLTQTVAGKAEASALTAEISARKEAVAELEAGTGLHLLESKTLAAQEEAYYWNISLEGIDWSAWKCVHIFLDPVCASTSDRYTITLNGNGNLSLGQQLGNLSATGTFRFCPHLLLFPFYNGRQQITGISLGVDSPSVWTYGQPFDGPDIVLEFRDTEVRFLQGSTCKIYGEK